MKVLFPPQQTTIDTGYANFDFDVQYLQSAAFSFEKCLNHQNHSFSGSHHLVKIPPLPQQNFQLSHPPCLPHFLQLFGKPCG